MIRISMYPELLILFVCDILRENKKTNASMLGHGGRVDRFTSINLIPY